MKSIDEMLEHSSAPEPRRGLRDGFSGRVMAHVADIPIKQMRLERLFRYRPVVVVMIALIIVGVLGGVSYAATDGFSFLQAIFSGEQTLKNGDTIVIVKTKDCASEWYSITQQDFASGDTTLYFRLKKNSSLTPKVVTQMVQGRCEQASSDAEWPSIFARLEMNDAQNTAATLHGNVNGSVVTAISSSSLTVRTVSYGYDGHNIVVDTHTFTHVFHTFADNMIVEDASGKALALGDIRPGDHVIAIYRANPNIQRDVYGNTSDDLSDTVVFIEKLSANMAFAHDFDRYYGKEFTRVEPCRSNSSGYCEEY